MQLPETLLSILLGGRPQGELLDVIGLCLHFEELPYRFPQRPHHLHSHRQRTRAPNPLPPCQYLPFLFLKKFIIAVLSGVTWYFTVVNLGDFSDFRSLRHVLGAQSPTDCPQTPGRTASPQSRCGRRAHTPVPQLHPAAVQRGGSEAQVDIVTGLQPRSVTKESGLDFWVSSSSSL